MAGSIFLRKTEITAGEADTTIQVEIARAGSLAGAVTIQYAIDAGTATPGLDFDGVGGSIVIPDGVASVLVPIDIHDDDLGEPTEVLTLSLTSATGATLSAPHATRIAIADDETSAPQPPAEPPLLSPYNLTRSTVIRGLDAPVRFIFAPNDPQTVLVAERAGIVRSVNMQTGATSVVLDIRGATNVAVERGLLDIAVHPDFAANPYLYVSHVVDPVETAGRTGTAGPDGLGNRFVHVVRYTMAEQDGAPSVVPGSGVVILGAGGQVLDDISGGGVLNFTDPALASEVASDRMIRPGDRVIGGFKQDYYKDDSLSHANGKLLFGPDGMLYVATGDGSSYSFADRRAADVQSLDSLSGKVLRIDPITGRGLDDNPFAADAEDLDANRAKIFQLGLRHPFTGGFDPEGRLFLGDVGWFSHEEMVMAGPGANFGWPYYEGSDGGVLAPTPQHSVLSGAAAFYAAVAAGDITITPAFRSFSHAAGDPGFRMQVILMGAYIDAGGPNPTGLEGHVLFSDFIGGNLFAVNADARADIGFVADWPGARGPVHMLAAPDGVIHYADLFLGEIGRLGIAEKTANPMAVLSVAAPQPTVLEGNDGTTGFAFTVSRSGATGAALNIGWSVAGGITIGARPADAGDFGGGVLPSGTIAFTAGQTSAVVIVPVAGDDVREGNESFQLMLGTPPADATVATQNADGTILDDDSALATLSIAAQTPSRQEGTGDTTDYIFVVTRQVSFDGAATAKWTAAGFVEAGTVPANAADFLGGIFPAGTVQFAPGQTTATITVAVLADALGELNERFAVTLSDPSEATAISTATAPAVILNDDANLAIAPLSQTYVEGDSGITERSFTVTRVGTTFASTVDWSVGGFGDRPAHGLDFVGMGFPSGALTFAAGETAKTITVQMVNDTLVEWDESFAVTLSNPSGGTTLTAPQAVVTITGNDTMFGVIPVQAREPEGTGGITKFTFAITRSGGAAGVMSVDWAASGIAGNGTLPASAADFAGGVLPSGTVTFAPGEIIKLVLVDVAADAQREFNERFAIDLLPQPGASLGLSRALGIIMNDDATLSIAPERPSVAEGNAGSTAITLTVTRAGDLAGTASVGWTLAPGGRSGTIPVSAADFAGGVLPVGGSLTFLPGQTAQQITLAIAGDTTPELNESFTVTLHDANGGAAISRGVAAVAVIDDDRILGTTGNDALVGTAGPDLFVIGTGLDSISGGAGRDQFRFVPAALGPASEDAFTFTDFNRAIGEVLDLACIDAIAGGLNDAFSFIGTAAFNGTPGQLRYTDTGATRLVQGNVNNDLIADLTIIVHAPGPVEANWFVL